MTTGKRQRAIVLGRYDTGLSGLEELLIRHRLRVVFTIGAPTPAKLAALIAIQHILEYDAEVVVVPYLTAAEIRADGPWRAVVDFADIVTAEGDRVQPWSR